VNLTDSWIIVHHNGDQIVPAWDGIFKSEDKAEDFRVKNTDKIADYFGFDDAEQAMEETSVETIDEVIGNFVN
jgi:hypothetical protein